MTTWTPCSEQMPPDDDTEYIIKYTYPNSAHSIRSGIYINLAVTSANANLIMWKPYTTELFKELNNE